MIRINDCELSKIQLLHLINNQQKPKAVKLIKDKTDIGLKDCKDIVDQLESNPNYYDRQSISKTIVNYSKTNQKKGSHLIKENSSNKKNLLVLLLILLAFIMLYMYSIK